MDYYLYKLKFTTPLHIGKSSGGSSLDDGQMTIHADTLFAALCFEAAKLGMVDELYNYFNDNCITISDALPYMGEELYLPKPIIYIKNEERESPQSDKKALKNLEYIPLSAFKAYLQFIRGTSEFKPDDYNNDFGNIAVNHRVALKGQSPPLPYHVAGYKFNSDCGLYIILQSQAKDAMVLFDNLLARLGLSGIGAKQTSGWGKFELVKSELNNELALMLNDIQAPYQMLLGTFLPEDEDLEPALTNSWYSLIRRGGFIRSAAYATEQLKKRTIYMLSAGSCLNARYEGAIFDLAEGGNHPVWRNGKSLFLGVNI